jgi:aryl-phospho-beta-D-glucosidase BglC (GH1 family)
MYNQSSEPLNDALNLTDIENLKSWGMNLVRLGVMWEAVEVSEGVYN